MKPLPQTLVSVLLAGCLVGAAFAAGPSAPVDFNQDIRPILSNKCFQCHGPDENERQGGGEHGYRLDRKLDAVADLGGYFAIVPGKPDESELIRRITSDDEFERMPPVGFGKPLSAKEVDLLTRWIKQGANFARHWSYIAPQRPPLPEVKQASWPRRGIDHFLLSRMEKEGLSPSPEADRHALIRRASLDLTGLPPTLEEVERFVFDEDPLAYEKLVDRLLKKQSYGEHWARKWLDLARYADSAGYADDPPRTIWPYRDYVIRALNENKPFDRFTIEQIAGDLLPDPTTEQLVATAFHRNTMTNNEGGTNDEEFRNVAVVDRVNTTMAVWMGTTMACAQCHSHKYDPITQEEYFRFFAILNNTEDADKRDESPLLEIWSDEQKEQKTRWQEEIAALKKKVSAPTDELLAAQKVWEKKFQREPTWEALTPSGVTLKSGSEATIGEDGTVVVSQPDQADTDVYTVKLPLSDKAKLTGFRLETLPNAATSNFVITRVLASIVPAASDRLKGRFVRVEIPGKQKILSLAEVEVFDGEKNVATEGAAKQVSTAFNGPAKLGIDGNTNGDYSVGSTTHTAAQADPWWELDLKSTRSIDRIVLHNRTDNNLHTRLDDFRLTVLDEQRNVVWEQTVSEPPNPSAEFSPSGVRSVPLAAAFADFSQQGFAASNVIDGKDPNNSGWAVSPQTSQPHQLTLIPQTPLTSGGATLLLTIEQLSKHFKHNVGRFRLLATGDEGIAEYASAPSDVLAALKTPEGERTETQQELLTRHYLSIAPELKADRQRLANVKKQLAEMKPASTAPIMRELSEAKRRTTHIQRRGNYLETGKEVSAGLPSAFHALPDGAPINRLTLARWLVDERNPLTARVIVNRYWEAIFGIGIVATSEEFGSQGEAPMHPELLDWLAVELMESGWDLKELLRLLTTSAAYRQSSRVTPELMAADPDNRLLARGPRFRLSAEMVRDQALFVSGLLSDKMYGPPVKPMQPSIGLNAAFGSGIDWKTSQGEDQYRRGLYTMWRRSNPYPSMAAFDAPNREVCTVRRDRTNTPLQALVTLNDPVYVEAAQSLARRMAEEGVSVSDKAVHGFRLCLARPPSERELGRLTSLYENSRAQFASDQQAAMKMATEPLGPLPEGADAADLAAWTVVANVLLNLDEMFMKR